MKTSFAFLVCAICIIAANHSFAQGMGINDTGAGPDNSSMLDVSSTTKGMLIPRMSTADRLAISSAAEGLMVYDTDLNQFWYYDGGWAAVGSNNNGVNPIGAIIAWHKSLTGTPAIPAGWVECNGQTLSDAGSPYNGQVIPNLNGTPSGGYSGGGRFLRGGTTSGIMQNSTTIRRTAAGGEIIYPLVSNEDGYINPDYTPTATWRHQLLGPVASFAASGFALRPTNMSVVYIMRVK